MMRHTTSSESAAVVTLQLNVRKRVPELKSNQAIVLAVSL